jgi:hypothetical protein
VFLHVILCLCIYLNKYCLQCVVKDTYLPPFFHTWGTCSSLRCGFDWLSGKRTLLSIMALFSFFFRIQRPNEEEDNYYWYLVFCVMFSRSLSFFFWPLCCLSFKFTVYDHHFVILNQTLCYAKTNPESNCHYYKKDTAHNVKSTCTLKDNSRRKL